MLALEESVAAWLWSGYIALLRVTLLAVAVAVASQALGWWRRSLRPPLLAAGLIGVLLIPLIARIDGLFIPLQLPDVAATGLIHLGAATMADPATVRNEAGPWLVFAAAVWLLGTGCVLARLLGGWLSMHLLTRRSRGMTAAWRARIDDAQAALGVRQRVDVRSSAEVQSPLTWGVVRPVILLPVSAAEWPEAYARAVLLHELAHVARRDCVLQVASQLACAMFWFHPLVWWLAAQHNIERELACDARVLRAGVRPSDYAECLLTLADHARLRGSAAAVAVSVSVRLLRPSRLKERVEKIIGGATVPVASSRAVSLTTVCALVFVVAAARVHFTASSELLRASLQAEYASVRAFAATALGWRGEHMPDTPRRSQ